MSPKNTENPIQHNFALKYLDLALVQTSTASQVKEAKKPCEEEPDPHNVFAESKTGREKQKDSYPQR